MNLWVFAINYFIVNNFRQRVEKGVNTSGGKKHGNIKSVFILICLLIMVSLVGSNKSNVLYAYTHVYILTLHNRMGAKKRSPGWRKSSERSGCELGNHHWELLLGAH